MVAIMSTRFLSDKESDVTVVVVHILILVVVVVDKSLIKQQKLSHYLVGKIIDPTLPFTGHQRPIHFKMLFI